MSLEMIAQCCACKMYALYDDREYWFRFLTDKQKEYMVSHTYCPPCAEREKEKLRYSRDNKPN
jgi:hypothetical protein